MTPEAVAVGILIACALAYYACGVIWLSSGIRDGWLICQPHPAMALKIALMALVWTRILAKCRADVERGQQRTEF